MSTSGPTRTAARRARSPVFAVFVVVLGIVGTTMVGVLLWQSLTSLAGSPATDEAATEAAPDTAPDTGPGEAPTDAAPSDRPSAPADRRRRPPRAHDDRPRALGDRVLADSERGMADGDRDVADGAVPAGVTAFDDEYPAVANLDPDLLDALRQATLDAADEGVDLSVNSGWRSPAYQNQLLREAISKYGSEEKAAQWVATAGTSPHVSGDAVDVGPSDAAEWLSEHGAAYGLCQIYRNEPWHYERRPKATTHGCPAMYADPTHDPRTQE